MADSVSPNGVRLTTLLTRYPRMIHAEMLRHRVFSHSVASSRAIPTERLIEQVRDDPFIPETFNERVKGMGVGEVLDDQESCQLLWKYSANNTAWYAEKLMEKGVDKSRVNRLLEPCLFVTDLITATEWSNFFALRDHPDAQLEFQKLAKMMRNAMKASEPFSLDYGEWHLPLLTTSEYPEALAEGNAIHQWDGWKNVSAGRCARVSYDKQEESEPYMTSRARAARLVESGHMSPFEHICRPFNQEEVSLSLTQQEMLRDWREAGAHISDWMIEQLAFSGNTRGWIQMRKEFDNEDDFSKILSQQESIS